MGVSIYRGRYRDAAWDAFGAALPFVFGATLRRGSEGLDDVSDAMRRAANKLDEARDARRSTDLASARRAEDGTPHCPPGSDNCFVAGTPVAVGWGEEIIAAVDPVSLAEDSTCSGVWFVLGLGTVVLTVLRKAYDRDRQRGSTIEPLDAVFAQLPLVSDELPNLDRAEDAMEAELGPGRYLPPEDIPMIQPASLAQRLEHSPHDGAMSRSPTGRWWSSIALLFAVACFALGISGSRAPWQTTALKASSPHTTVGTAPTRQLLTRPIEQLRLGQRTIGTNPLREQTDTTPEPNRSTWAEIHLHLTKSDSSSLEIELLRPRDWLTDQSADVGNQIFLDMPELGALGWAKVMFVGPCPEIETGDGNLVTGRFIHRSAGNLRKLYLSGDADAIGVTGNHPFWSVSRQAFVEVDHLQPGERLDTAYGPTTVSRIDHDPADQTVYNLEIHGEHVYRVGRTGSLIHNTYSVVYRVIRQDELDNIHDGIKAKNPLAEYKVEGHILNGSRPGWMSQFISTTTDINVAKKWAEKSSSKIVEIDLTKLGDSRVIDLSTDAGRIVHLKSARARGYAKSSSELLIEGAIPPGAIKLLE